MRARHGNNHQGCAPIARAVVVGGKLAINEPLESGVSLHAKLLAQLGLLGGINLCTGTTRSRGGICGAEPKQGECETSAA